MTDRLFWLRAQSPGGHWVRTGCLALGIVMLFLLATSVLDTAFHIHVSRWYARTHILLLLNTIEVFGVVSIVIGCAQLIGERS